MPKNVIAVCGATGAQGGGLVNALLADGTFAVRALTRNPDSDKSKAMSAKGVEVVRADFDDAATLDAAFEGAYGAYLVTNFWEHMSAEKEMEQLKVLAAAVKKAGVKHVVNSTLEDTRVLAGDDDTFPTLQGKYKVLDFDAKGEANRTLFTDVPMTSLYTSFYMETFIQLGIQADEAGNLSITMPLGTSKMNIIAVGDIGRYALAVLKAPEIFIGKSVGVSGDLLSGDEIAAKLTTSIGKPVLFNAVPPEVYATFGFPGADSVASMFHFYDKYSKPLQALRDVTESNNICPGLVTFDEWLVTNASAFQTAE